MLPSLRLSVDALFTVTARIKYFVVPYKTRSCDLLILSSNATVNELAHDAVRNVLKRSGTNYLDMEVQAEVRDRVLPHLKGSIDNYVVSQLHVPGMSAEQLSSFVGDQSFLARFGEGKVPGHSIAFDFVAITSHRDGVYEF